jgi:hypothetical protein
MIASLASTGQLAQKSSFDAVRYVCAIRLSVMGGDASKRMTIVTTGSDTTEASASSAA